MLLWQVVFTLHTNTVNAGKVKVCASFDVAEPLMVLSLVCSL